MDWDIVVAGSGPSASLTAHLLARAGVRVLVVDRIDQTIFKVGEVLPGAASRLLRSAGITTPDVSGAHARIVGSLSSWESADLVASDALYSLDGPSWRLNRARFDAELRCAANNSGASFRMAFVQRVRREGSSWSLLLDDGSAVQARWAVDATGRRSVLSRLFGAKRNRDTFLVAIYARSEQAAVGPRSQRTVVEATADGWWYAAYLPSGRALAGIHVSPRNSAKVRDKDEWLKAWARTRHVSGMFPEMMTPLLLPPMDAGGARTHPLHGDRWLACGDAAFCFEPLSSQGILTALYSGRLAADFILQRLLGHSDATYGTELARVWETYRRTLKSHYATCAFRWN